MMRVLTVAVMLAVLCACSETESMPEYRDLEPYDNPAVSAGDFDSAEPLRWKPGAMAYCGRSKRLFVALPGTVDRPADRVAAVDVERRRVIERYEVGSGPASVDLHPGGRHLVVANRFSNYLTVVDIDTGESRRHPVDFYTERLLFDAEGRRLYLVNRHRDELRAMQVVEDEGGLQFSPVDELPGGEQTPVDFNPGKLALSESEDELYVASVASLSVTAVDVGEGAWRGLLTTASPVDVDDDPAAPPFLPQREIPPGVARVWLGAPAFDVAADGEHLYVATLSGSTHHDPTAGDEDHRYTPPVDGSPNRGFQALQNEIAVIDRATLHPRARYTSASYCCSDVRDVPPDDPDRGHLVPDESLRIVEGALPTAVATAEVGGVRRLFVAFGGSSQIQRFDLDGGRLKAGPVADVGFDPREMVVDGDGGRLLVSNRLGESVSIVDLESVEVEAVIDLRDEAAPAFPATDRELGELAFYSGAAFSVDGDQTCNHCHFDRGNIGKFFFMPNLADPRGSRMTTDVRGLHDTRPWFQEGAFGPDEVFPAFLHMTHADNFCCEDHPDPDDCVEQPPSKCFEAPYSTRPTTRDRFFKKAAHRLVERRRSFGDAHDVALDFEGVNRLVARYLTATPGLLPNPNPGRSDAAERGRLLFESPSTGCAVCHPAPSFGVSKTVNPSETPLVFGPVVEPARDEDGKNLNLVTDEFLRQFPAAVQRDGDVFFTATSLRGMWDRAPGFYHHGRVRTLREALATPGHPALDEEQRGYNVADGVVDAHGGTSHLTEDELRDLIEYLLTL